MTSLSNKVILVCDLSGNFTFIAERLAKDFGSVKYFNFWQTGFSSSKDFLPGLGLKEVEHVPDFFNALDKVDIVMFSDVGYGDLQEFLRRQGIPLFGSGAAQVLELDRWQLKEALKKENMSIARSRLIIGIDALRKIIRTEEDLYIKGSWFRADFETFHHLDYFRSETWLDELATRLGPYGRIASFLVEETIEGEAVEVGVDTHCIDGNIPENPLWGYELKDSSYILTTDPLPERLDENTRKFVKILKQYDYKGPVSTEVKITEDDEYFLDACLREGSPPSEIQCALIENFSEIIYEGAMGHLIEPIYAARYGVELILKSDWVIEHPLALKIGNPERTFIHGHFQIDDQDYAVVPGEFAEFGAAVGIGDSLENAIREAFETVEEVEGYQIRYEAEAFSKTIEEIKKGEKLDITWANLPRNKDITEHISNSAS